MLRLGNIDFFKKYIILCSLINVTEKYISVLIPKEMKKEKLLSSNCESYVMLISWIPTATYTADDSCITEIRESA